MATIAYIMDGPYRGAVLTVTSKESLLLPHPLQPSSMLRYSQISGYCWHLVGVCNSPKKQLIVGRIICNSPKKQLIVGRIKRPRPTTVEELPGYLLAHRHVFITDPILGRRKATYLGVYDGWMVFLNGIAYPFKTRDFKERFTITIDDAGFTLSDDRDSIRFDYLDWS